VAPRRPILRDPIWLDAIIPTVLIRAVLLVFGVLAVILFRPDALPQGSLLEIWQRWDAPHFQEIAKFGYWPPADPARIVLFPLFPALLAIGSRLGDPLLLGMVIAFVSTLAAAAGLYRLVRLDDDRRTARIAVIAMSVFPTAFTLVAPYSEAPFLAFTVWAFVQARRGDWRGAGLLALLAGATRLQGAFLLPALAVEYWLSRRRLDRDAAWLLLAAGGPLIYLGINQVVFGDPLYFLEIQRSVFAVGTAPPWHVIGSLLSAVLQPQPSEFWLTIYVVPLGAFVIIAGTMVWTIIGHGSRPSFAIYTGLSLLTFVTLSWPISVPRYLMGVFPIFIATARLARRPWLGAPLLLASTATMLLCLILFVTGHWAF